MMGYPTPVELIYWVVLKRNTRLLDWKDLQCKIFYDSNMSYPTLDAVALIDEYGVKDEYQQRLQATDRSSNRGVIHNICD